MDVTETLYVTDRDEWRSWLAAHHADKSEIWLVSYRKSAGHPNLPYSDAVEEALCFGWIDSVRKTIDENRYAQRFSPRRAGSNYSQTNKERLARLIAQGKVIPSLLSSLEDVRPEDYEIPDDIVSALKLNRKAWTFFRTTAPSYQRIRAAYVDAARKRPSEFAKRLKNLVEMSAQEKQFGYGIEDYY